MIRLTTLVLAAVVGGTVLGGAAYAAQDQAAPPAGKHHGHRFAKLDTDHDGIITRAEAEAGGMKRFDRFDTNHDGKIDQTEIAAAKAKIRERMQARRAAAQAGDTASAMPPADQSDDQ